MGDHIRSDGMHQLSEATDISGVEGQHHVLHSGLLVGCDAGDHPRRIISGEARAVGGALTGWGSVGFYFHSRGHHQTIRVAARRLGELPDTLTADGEFLGAHAGGMPSVASAGGATQGTRATATNP